MIDTETKETKTDVLRDKKGRMLAPLPGGAPKITTETARSMVQKRWDNYRKAAVRAIVKEAVSIDPEAGTGANAFGLVAAKQYSALMDSDKPRIADLEKLGQIMTGMASGPQRANEPAPGNSISAPPAALLELAAMIERSQRDAVDRARAVDVEATDTRNE